MLKFENSNSFGQILGLEKDIEAKLIKTIEAPVDESGSFEAKIDNLETGKYILRAYGKDERGAISDAFSDIVIEVAGKSVLSQSAKWVFNTILSGFDGLIKFIMNGWLIIFITLFAGGLIYAIAEKAIPAIKHEIKKINYIIGEYRMDKKLKNRDSKIRLEIRVISEDIKKELIFLRKIENHRRLHPDEQYLKNKLKRYNNLIKNMK